MPTRAALCYAVRGRQNDTMEIATAQPELDFAASAALDDHPTPPQLLWPLWDEDLSIADARAAPHRQERAPWRVILRPDESRAKNLNPQCAESLTFRGIEACKLTNCGLASILPCETIPVMKPIEESPINKALRQFEASEANLAKLERLWSEMWKLVPKGFVFDHNSAYEQHIRDYRDVLEALPKIDGWKPEHIPMELNEVFQSRIDAQECNDISADVAVEDQIRAPARELAEYRHRLNRKRRQLIRSAMTDLIAAVDETLRLLGKSIPKNTNLARQLKSALLEKLAGQAQEIESLLGSGLPRPDRWKDLRRHIHFGTIQDVMDIIRVDWPEAKVGLDRGLYDQNEPIPVEVSDLATLASAQPKGRVVTKLKWESLTDEDFERLVFSLIASAPGYENPEWLTKTKAPDRGRDLSVYRIINDSLGGTVRRRVLIQCRNWNNASVSPAEVATLKEQVTTWEPPRVDVLIIATSGRFTTDAVTAIEKNNIGDRALQIEMWPESHIERLLAERPALIAEFRLR